MMHGCPKLFALRRLRFNAVRCASGARGARSSRTRGALKRHFSSQGRGAEADYMLLAYGWQRPRSVAERGFSALFGSGATPVEYFMRAIGQTWTTTEAVETGLDDGSNAVLPLPPGLQESLYQKSKMAPGVLVRYKLPDHGAVAHSSPLAVGYLETEFRGVLLGRDDTDYFVHPLEATEFQLYDSGQSALDAYDVRLSIRVPHAYVLDAGQAERRIFPHIPLGVYAAFTVPKAFSRVQVMLDDKPVDVTQQTALIPAYLFRERLGSTVSDIAEAAGFVKSAVGLRVDEVNVPILVPLCQLV